MKRPPYTPGDRIRIVTGRNAGQVAEVVRVCSPALEVRVEGGRVYQLVTPSVRLMPPHPQERKAA